MPIQEPIGSGFGLRSEPEQIMAGIDLGGRNAIVTGGYSGIGVETVRALAAAGAAVTVPARNLDKARSALADVAGNVTIAAMDLADIASVRAFAAGYVGDHERLDLLINNAGIMACPLARIGNGWEMQFGTNHLGHFELARGLTPLLERTGAETGAVRVVALTSIGHRRSDVLWDDPGFDATEYDKWAAYGQSKTANSLFALGLDTRMADKGVRAFSVHPGGILTPLQRHLPREEMVAMGWVNADGELTEAARAGFKTTTQGCTTSLWAATSPQLDGMGGLYCENCDVAQLVGDDNAEPRFVRAHAVDAANAERLWAMSEDMLAAV